MYTAIERVFDHHKRAVIRLLCQDFSLPRLWLDEDQVWQPELREYNLLQFYILHYTPEDESVIQRMLYLQNWINGTPDNFYLHLQYQAIGGKSKPLTDFIKNDRNDAVVFDFHKHYEKKKPYYDQYRQTGKCITVDCVNQSERMVTSLTRPQILMSQIAFAVRLYINPFVSEMYKQKWG